MQSSVETRYLQLSRIFHVCQQPGEQSATEMGYVNGTGWSGPKRGWCGVVDRPYLCLQPLEVSCRPSLVLLPQEVRFRHGSPTLCSLTRAWPVRAKKRAVGFRTMQQILPPYIVGRFSQFPASALPPAGATKQGSTLLRGHAGLHASVGCLDSVRMCAFVLSSTSILCALVLPNISPVRFHRRW